MTTPLAFRNQFDLATIASHFQFEGRFLQAERLPSGHINDSYAISFRLPNGRLRRYLLQRINHHVFRTPEKLMQNIEAITTHLRAKIAHSGGDPERETLTLIPTLDGSLLHRTPGGHYWRAAIFIEGARAYDAVESLDHVCSIGRAFGDFQRRLGDFPADQLHETIPNFHHTPKRFTAFVQAVERDVANRARSVQAEIAFVEQRAAGMPILVDLMAQGQLPLRVTHNDTKFNNVMIDDDTGEGVCVIDLDTVMPGLSLYDFGDALRSGANAAAEDAQNVSQVTLDLDIVDHFAAGYLHTTRNFLTPLEIEYLPLAAQLMTLECGMRFLTDYLDGDRYFRTHRPDHNLDRCRTQFKLVQEIEARLDDLAHIIERHLRA